MSVPKPVPKPSASSKTGNYDTITRPRNRCVAQSYVLVWVDLNLDETRKDYQRALTQLRVVVNDVRLFTEPEECIQLLRSMTDEKVFLITSGSLGQSLVPKIASLPKLHAIYIFCSNKARHEEWAKTCVKIKGVYTRIDDICAALTANVEHPQQDAIAVSFVMADASTVGQNLNQLQPSFMYTQIFKDILLKTEYDRKAVKDLAAYCRKVCLEQEDQLDIIDEFERDYHPQRAILWYTRHCFLYQMLNQALLTLHSDTIIHMGFFIRDLHYQIQELHDDQLDRYQRASFVVYRGQSLSRADFEALRKSKDGLMAFNNFLSTSEQLDVSLRFAERAMEEAEKIGILFVMNIDPGLSKAPFASIRKFSYIPKEKEILFSMHTIFRIGVIKRMDNSRDLYEVKLQLTSDTDEQLRVLTERIRMEIAGETGWERLGCLLLKIGHYDKAEELYETLIKQTRDKSERAMYLNQLGCVKDEQGDYEKAITCYKQALQIKEKTLPSDHPSLAISYNNIGSVHMKMKEYSTALSYYEMARDILQRTLPADHLDLATSYNNIGSAYNNMRDHSTALSFYKQALRIRRKALPSNHPSLAVSYNNIAFIYVNLKDYAKALSYFERAQVVWQHTLPADHPNLKMVKESIETVKTKLSN